MWKNSLLHQMKETKRNIDGYEEIKRWKGEKKNIKIKEMIKFSQTQIEIQCGGCLNSFVQI